MLIFCPNALHHAQVALFKAKVEAAHRLQAQLDAAQEEGRDQVAWGFYLEYTHAQEAHFIIICQTMEEAWNHMLGSTVSLVVSNSRTIMRPDHTWGREMSYK